MLRFSSWSVSRIFQPDDTLPDALEASDLTVTTRRTDWPLRVARNSRETSDILAELVLESLASSSLSSDSCGFTVKYLIGLSVVLKEKSALKCAQPAMAYNLKEVRDGELIGIHIERSYSSTD